MSNAVALPKFEIKPVLTRALAEAMWLVNAEQAPSDEARAEARALMAASAAMMKRANPMRVRVWLEWINFGMSQPVPVREFDLRVAVLVAAMASYPAAVFTEETAIEIVRKQKWLPGAAELADLLGPRLRDLERFELDLRRIADAPEPPPPRPEPTEQEREAVNAILREIPKTGRHDYHPPLRTVEEQIAAMKNGG